MPCLIQPGHLNGELHCDTHGVWWDSARGRGCPAAGPERDQLRAKRIIGRLWRRRQAERAWSRLGGECVRDTIDQLRADLAEARAEVGRLRKALEDAEEICWDEVLEASNNQSTAHRAADRIRDLAGESASGVEAGLCEAADATRARGTDKEPGDGL